MYLVAHLEVCIESIPWMWSKLLQTESNALLLVVEVDNNNVELLIEFYNLVWIAYAAPREVCDVDETINATEVDEYTVRSDVLNGTFKNLTLLELANDFLLLSLELCFDESLVANYNVAEFLVDLNNLEFHGLTNECIVVADRLHVNLAAWEECFCTKYVNNHTTLSAALHEALNDFVFLKRSVYALPRACSASLCVGEYETTLLVLKVFNVNLYCVANGEFWIVAEFVGVDNALAFVANVNYYFAVVDS